MEAEQDTRVNNSNSCNNTRARNAVAAATASSATQVTSTSTSTSTFTCTQPPKATAEATMNNPTQSSSLKEQIKLGEAELKRLVQEEAMSLPDMDIAVSGIAGRFPKADSVNEFEEHLYNGTDMVNDEDEARFSCRLWGLPPRAGRLKDLSRFDCEFFGFTPEEANYIDFQQRILYEVVYESMLDAGVNPASLRGSNTGVFFGLHCNEFENAMADDPSFKGNGYYSQFAVKVAQYFDLRGINVTFDAACASGFVGLHNAIHALNDGLIDTAIVCSSNIPIHPTGNFIFLQMQMLSPTGYSRFLDSRADGYVKSEACVSVLLQKKHLALRNYASIMASMTSVDGFKPEGITFPSDKSQEALIRKTKQLAGISTNHVEYLEAHGTGTPAGDPQEASAISNVYCDANGGEDERKIGPLLVCSVKTNMGHSEAASGLCSLAKGALMLENELIYKGLHFSQPNSNIGSLLDGRLKFVDEQMPLRSKIIPLSCYGFGGSNVHTIIRANHRPAIGQEQQELLEAEANRSTRLIVMFGRNEETLSAFFDQLLDQGSRYTRNCLSNDFLLLIDSLNSGKIDRLMSYRGYMIVDCSTNALGGEGEPPKELMRNIKHCNLRLSEAAILESQEFDNQQAQQYKKSRAGFDLGRRIHLQESEPRKCNLILPGLGCQWPAMASGLQEYKPFWATIERLSDLLRPFESDVNLIETLCNPTIDPSSTMTRAFVSIVAYQVALIHMVRDQLKLENLGSIVGHSLGEISCAYASGLFDEREAIMVAYQIGKTLDENKHLISGKMFAFAMDEQEAEKRIQAFASSSSSSTLAVSCVNGPQSVTISGDCAEMDQFCLAMENNQIFMKQIESCSIALHNQIMMGEQIKQLLKASILKVLFPLADYNRDKTNWLSSVPEACFLTTADNDKSLPSGQANAEYFALAMCKKVDFLTPLQQLGDDSIVLELGPNGSFESQLRQLELTSMKTSSGGSTKKASSSSSNNSSSKFHYVKLMKHSTSQNEQQLLLVKSIGELYQAGATMNWVHFNFGKKLQLPVRRQTPSISSLVKWNHKHELFVPRYPVQFSKSSAKCEIPVDIVQDRDKYIIGHCIEGRILFPATGYLFLIWRVFSFTKRKIYDACFHDCERELVPIEFHNVRLLRAVILGNRVTQIYVHYEEGTGRFEVREGGSVVVEGYARTPTESPNGLLHEHVKDQIRAENLELTLNADDVYKQFRVSGYDYGETFRNIEQSSADGRYCRVKYNGRFVALTDSILQSIFLAISQYAPSGGLFLPTKFDYVRFQPELILAKIRQAKMVFDLGDGSLNTKAKREIMTKIMQRESGDKNLVEEEENNTEQEQQGKDGEQSAEEEPKPECIFETFCDPITGIIITDGIEMRGIKASPAPRRSDNKEVLLESYQFVKDFEKPVHDETLTSFKILNEPYSRICDSMSIQLLEKLCAKSSLLKLDAICDLKSLASKEEISAYKKAYLSCLYKLPKIQRGAVDDNGDDEGEDEEQYDIKKNGPRMLMSVLDQLEFIEQPKFVRDIVQRNRNHLMADLIQTPIASERFMRPLIETVIENTCTKKMKLKMMEINVDDGLMKDSLQRLIQSVEPTMQLDYLLAHPDLNRLVEQKLLTSSDSSSSKMHTLKDLQTLFSNKQLKDLDLIIYKDISCYSLPKQVIEQNGLAPVLTSLNGATRLGGFVIMVMRQKLTLAERILLALSEPELIGLKKKDLELICGGSKGCGGAAASAIDKINHINAILTSRCELMISEANKNKMSFIAQKTDQNGCTVLMFKTAAKMESEFEETVDSAQVQQQQQELAASERVLLRVQHNGKNNIACWLEDLKRQFKKPEEEKATDEGGRQQETKSDEAEKKVELTNMVWLCAVATKQNPISGLVGMMRALLKELGQTRLRCFYDCHTFRDCDEPVSLKQIESSEHFKTAVERGLLWNCVDPMGNFGSFRHFTVNNYMDYNECLCENADKPKLIQRQEKKQQQQQLLVRPVKGAYVNNANRGDLSSFTWFEAPFEFSSEEERRQMVRIAYSALNFRDIMLSTGRLPLDAIPIKLAMSDCLLGLEFSGFDTRGKRVMGMVAGRGIATHVICPEKAAIKVELPDWLGLKEAATIPVVYATAIMALLLRGRMKRGESILIHAGSGGVGQAAIRLCAHFGVEIYTTVGSDEKRKFLLEEFGHCLKDERIFSSRSCNFESQIMEATGGRGVDLVLNSLADDKLQASVRCLSDGGRFLEIGKYDMSTDARLELLRLDTNKTFHGILLDKMFETDEFGPAFANQVQCVLDILKDGLVEGYVKPIKHTTFKRHQVEEAFRFMATGKHIGKVLIEIDEHACDSDPLEPVAMRCVPRFQLSSLKTYIVTGGLGGFGLELTKWLVSKGARFIAITSRSGLKTGYQKATLHRLESSEGVKFLIVDNSMADTTTEVGVAELCRLARELSPENQVGGLFHLAMVLKDSLLENMSADDFEMVCKPKLETCYYLDLETRCRQNLNLDYFVAFSSVTSGKGNAGQANYAYANSCLERICELRRANGEHGLAIQWGAIGDVGVAFENLGGNDVIIGGTKPQRMPSCLATLSRILCSPFSTCLSVLPVNKKSDAAGEKGDLVGTIMHVLGIKDPSKVSEQSTLGELGLDSLMAVEIRQYIEREYDMTLNIQEIRSLTIAKIRDISENGKPAAAKQAAAAAAANDGGMNGITTDDGSLPKGDEESRPKEVQSYGTNLAASSGSTKTTSNEATSAAASTDAKGLKELVDKAAMFDKSRIAPFKPQLVLPTADYCKLNCKQSLATSREANGQKQGLRRKIGAGKQTETMERPIFFIPPIHGEFGKLEQVAAHIERPCLGLNWNRKLGRVRTVSEAVEIYLDLLNRADWQSEFLGQQTNAGNQNAGERIVDLVGYSFGATIAFELMLAIHKQFEKTRKHSASNGVGNGNGKKHQSNLKPGRLILLDGSPKHLELGQQYMTNLAEGKNWKLSEKLEELLMSYVAAHTLEINFLELRSALRRADLEEKVRIASERLVEALNLRETQLRHESDSDSDSEHVDFESHQIKVAHAMEAFCRRYELIDNYRVIASLPDDCTLIRAGERYLSTKTTNGGNGSACESNGTKDKNGTNGGNKTEEDRDDYELASVVKGKVSLFVMEGNHDSFLDENGRQIGEIITKHCNNIAA